MSLSEIRCTPFVTAVTAPVERYEVEVARAAVVDSEVDAARVGRPRQVVGRAIELRRQCAAVSPVRCLMTYSSLSMYVSVV